MNAGADVTINEGTSASLRGTATDPDSKIASYTWTQGARTFSGANATIPFGDNGVFNVTLRVCDNASPAACTSDTVVVTVRNVAPTLRSIVDKTTVERIDTSQPFRAANFAQVTLEVAGSDVPADTLTYRWNFGDGTGWHTLPARYTRGFQLGQFDGQVTVSDDDGGTSAPLHLKRITVMATGDCNGQSSQTIAARLYDWWGAGTQVTVYNDTVMWFLRGTSWGQVKPKYVFRPGQVTTTRGAGQGSQGPMLQSGCPGKTRFIGIASPSSQYTDTYLPENKLIKLP